MIENLELFFSGENGYIDVSVSACEEIVSVLVTGDVYPESGVYRKFSKAESLKWLSALEELHIEKWRAKYTPAREAAGKEIWKVEYRRVGKRCRHISGTNAYPRNWEAFIELLDELAPLINPARIEKIELLFNDNDKFRKYTEEIIIERETGVLIYRQSAGNDISVTKEYRKKDDVVKLIDDCGMYFELFDRKEGAERSGENDPYMELALSYHRHADETIRRA